MVYVLKPTRAIWRYLLSKFCALLCCSLSQCNTWWFSKCLEAASKLRQHFWSVLSSTGPSRNARAQLSFVEPYEWVSVCSSACCCCCCCCYTISLMTSSQDKANDSGVSLHAREIEYLFRQDWMLATAWSELFCKWLQGALRCYELLTSTYT